MKFYEGIEGYGDMTAEEKLKALEALDDSDTKKWKAQFDKASHEAAENRKLAKSLQEQLDGKLSEEEKLEAERERELADIIAERDSLKRESAISKLMGKYVAMGYSEELAEATANAQLDGDTDTVIANQIKFNEGLEQIVRTKIVQSNPTPDVNGTSAPKMTKAEIMAIKDTAKRQKAIAENIELFG